MMLEEDVLKVEKPKKKSKQKSETSELTDIKVRLHKLENLVKMLSVYLPQQDISSLSDSAVAAINDGETQ